MGKSLSQLEATQAVAVALQRQITDLEQQRDAALELAALYARLGNTDKETTQADRYARAICRQHAADIRAIFAPKEGK